MVRISLISLFLVASQLFAVGGMSTDQIDVGVGLENVFVPKGFDSNDNIEIVVSGELPNTCYLRPRGEVKVVNDRVYVEMKATKIIDRNVMCIQAIVPYMVSVPLGQLNEGSYDIKVNAGATSEKDSSILIEQPNSASINNFTYANVTGVTAASADREVVLSGYHPSSCMEIDRVEIFPNENNDTYSVLPIIKQTQPICDRMIKPFNHTLHLPAAHKDQQLVHVRKIDGTAVNFIVKEKPARRQ